MTSSAVLTAKTVIASTLTTAKAGAMALETAGGVKQDRRVDKSRRQSQQSGVRTRAVRNRTLTGNGA